MEAAQAEAYLAHHHAVTVECSQIWQGLYQGSMPDDPPLVGKSGFHIVVLCAEEYQPPFHEFSGVQVYYCPLDDTEERPLDRNEKNRIRRLSTTLASHLRRGKRVLITCAMGLNRSGVVTAATLTKIGIHPKDAVALVKHKRPFALSNRVFVSHLLAGHLI